MDQNQRILLRRPKLPSKPVLPKIYSTSAEMTLDIPSAYDDGTSFTLTDSRPDQDYSTPGISESKITDSYREYTFEGASPPPPSELSAAIQHERFSTSLFSTENTSHHEYGRPTRKTLPLAEPQYMIDPNYRQPTNLGTYVEGKSLLRPQKRRGPAPLPARAPLQANPALNYYYDITDEWESRYVEFPEFTFDDFVVHLSEVENFDFAQMSKMVYSKQNYKQIQQMLFETYICPRDPIVKKVNVRAPEDMKGYPATRVPQRQLIIEMASLIKQQMNKLMNVKMVPVIRPMRKYHPNYRPDEPRPHTEIILYEEDPKASHNKKVIKKFHPCDKPDLTLVLESEDDIIVAAENSTPGVPLRPSHTFPNTSTATLISKEPSKLTKKTTKSEGFLASPENAEKSFVQDTADTKENTKFTMTQVGSEVMFEFEKEEEYFKGGGDIAASVMNPGEMAAHNMKFHGKEPTLGSKTSWKHQVKEKTETTKNASAKSRSDQVLGDRQQSTKLSGSHRLIETGSAQYFQGSRRSASPFETSTADTISPAELAVLDSIMAGGQALSLKAHFITSLPNIGGLNNTLVYLNLSFNNFTKVPPEVMEIVNLETLKLRDNPLQRIPETVGRLQKLSTLVVSFCLLTSLPDNLFLLPNLQHLDIAYNKIQALPGNIGQLSELQELNLEGNQVRGLPASLMKLKNLKRLRVRNNFMHPAFWKDSVAQVPPKLGDLAATAICRTDMTEFIHTVPEHIANKLQQKQMCECCMQPYLGQGLQFLRHVSQMFGIKQLPFLFIACTPACFWESRSDETLINMFL